MATARPVANFTTSPANPLSGEEVKFTSTSTDSDGSVASLAWDLDNDGNFDDGSKVEMRKTFLLPGPQVIRLRVVDNDGDFDVHQVTINVINRAPVPSDQRPSECSAEPRAGHVHRPAARTLTAAS